MKDIRLVVACFTGMVPTDAIVERTVQLANMYSRLQFPLVIPEVTGIGQAFVEQLRKKYDKIYVREVFNARTRKKMAKLGFSTNFATKQQLIENFRNLLQKGYPKICDAGTHQELKTFIYADEAQAKGAAAQKGFHDDRVMATMLAYWNLEPKSEKESFIRKELQKMARQRRVNIDAMI